MLFKQEHIELIKQGVKRQTRRDWKRPAVSVGGTYPIMRDYRHKHNKEDGYIQVSKIFMQSLKAMSEQDAKEEGLYTKEEYFQKWLQINHSIDIDKPIYVIKFIWLNDKV